MDQPENQIELEGDDELTNDSHEIARIWVHDGAGSSVWIAAHKLPGARSFGRLMADTVRHGARAYATTYGLEEHEALQEIVNGVGQELREQFEEITTIQPGSLHS